MKTKLSVLLALAAALGSPGVHAQEQQQQPPQSPTPFSGPAPTPSAPPPAPSEATPPTQPPPPPRSERRRGEDEEFRHQRRGDRERNWERGPDRERERNGERPRGPRGPHGGERPMEPQPFLGVMTSPVPPPVGAQLGLPEDFGLLVQEVLPDSPAAKAGLQKYDILKLFNDQQLVDPNQLATLVRAAGKNASASLTVIRKGQEQKLNVTIGERMMPVRKQMEEFFGHGPMMDRDGGPEEMERFHERVRKLQERAREWRERQSQREAPDRKDSANARPGDILREARPGGGGRISIYDEDRVTTIDGSKARLVLKDDDGEIEVSTENGKRMLTAKNPKGEVVFRGPVNTEEERKAVPEQFRSKLERIHVRQQREEAARRREGPGGPDQNDAPREQGDFL